MFNMKTDWQGAAFNPNNEKQGYSRNNMKRGLQGGNKNIPVVLCFFWGGGFLDLKHGVFGSDCRFCFSVR